MVANCKAGKVWQDDSAAAASRQSFATRLSDSFCLAVYIQLLQSSSKQFGNLALSSLAVAAYSSDCMSTLSQQGTVSPGFALAPPDCTDSLMVGCFANAKREMGRPVTERKRSKSVPFVTAICMLVTA